MAGVLPDYLARGLRLVICGTAVSTTYFHGKAAAKYVSREFGHGADVSLGIQAWTVAARPVFVLPSASGANRSTKNLEGKASRQEWFAELKRALP